MSNTKAILLSLLYISFVIGVSSVVSKKYSKEISRKLIHISLGNWVFFYPLYSNIFALVFVPVLFIFINWLSTKHQLISAMERESDDGLGTVYYAVSLFVLAGLSFLVNNQMPLFVGVLCMAYGDGFAAIVGKRFGDKLKIGSTNKSIPGSVTVSFFCFLITFIGLQLLNTSDLSFVSIAMISLLNGALGCFVEYVGDKGIDNILVPLSTGIFAYLSALHFDLFYLLSLGVMGLILGFAFRKKSITLDGCIVAFLTGISLYQLGSLALFANLLVFFIAGSLVSKLTNSYKEQGESIQSESSARSWVQVVANSLPATLCVWLIHIDPRFEFLALLPFIVLAVPFADTFASELGMLSRGSVRSILTWNPLPAGLSGGITILGTGAGLLGAFISALFVLNTFDASAFVLVFFLGFLGMILDSLLGATIQRSIKIMRVDFAMLH